MGSVYTSAKGDRGFTLLELLISITMLALILVIIFGAARLGFRSVESAERKMEGLERKRMSLSFITSQIGSHVPLTYDDNGTKRFYFSGLSEAMEFSTNYSIWGGQKGYVNVTYRVEADSGRKQSLFVSESSVVQEGVRETKLLEGLDSISFEYYYKDPTEENGEWVEEWTDDQVTPEKVRLRLVEGTRSVSLIIPMRVKGTLSQAGLTSEPQRRLR